MKIQNLFLFIFFLAPQMIFAQHQNNNRLEEVVNSFYKAKDFKDLYNYYQAVDEVKCAEGGTNWCEKKNIYQLHVIAGFLHSKGSLFSDSRIQKNMIEYEKAIRACRDASSMGSVPCKNLIDLKLLFWGKYSKELKTKSASNTILQGRTARRPKKNKNSTKSTSNKILQGRPVKPRKRKTEEQVIDFLKGT